MGRFDGGDRGDLLWGRADLDNAPFRGPAVPMMTAEEMEERAVKVYDPQARTFDMSDPADAKDYLNILDCIYNGWWKQLYVRRFAFRNRKTRKIRIEIYLEWLQVYMEDGRPMPSQRPFLARPNDD